MGDKLRSFIHGMQELASGYLCLFFGVLTSDCVGNIHSNP